MEDSCTCCHGTYCKQHDGANNQRDKVNNQYPLGTDLLWMAHYRPESGAGTMDGPAVKLSGTLEKAAAQAQKKAEENGWILQCLRRRY